MVTYLSIEIDMQKHNLNIFVTIVRNNLQIVKSVLQWWDDYCSGLIHILCYVCLTSLGLKILARYREDFIFVANLPDLFRVLIHTSTVWILYCSALEAQSKLGGEDLIPFYGLLEGGRDGELFAELEDYFYYAQLRQ